MHAGSAQLGLPDLTLEVRRDGAISSWTGGDAVPALRQALVRSGQFSAASTVLLTRLARQCIANRASIDVALREGEGDYEVRVLPRGPDRVMMTLRPALPKATDNTVDDTGMQRNPAIERRGFTRQLRDRLSRAALRERPLAVVMFQIEGSSALAQSIGARVAERVVAAALGRIRPPAAEGESPELLGQISETLLAVVIDTGDRQIIDQRVASIRSALCAPEHIQGVEFRLECHVGVAIAEQGNATPTDLMDQASAAALEARHSGDGLPRFHSDTVRVRAMERVDRAHELRDAIARREVSLRFTSRCDLATGAVVALLGYLHWSHPLRGSIRPSDFLTLAESTGVAPLLSRTSFEMLCADFGTHLIDLPAGARLSFGPLRGHVLESSFVRDVLGLVDQYEVPGNRLELRIAERTFIACDPGSFDPLRARGVQLVIDEVGREVSSFATLSQTSLWGLQIDRRWAKAPADDFQARKVCRAVSALASALGLEALATGVDDERSRDALLGLGFHQGTGDLFARRSEAPQRSKRPGFFG